MTKRQPSFVQWFHRIFSTILFHYRQNILRRRPYHRVFYNEWTKWTNTKGETSKSLFVTFAFERANHGPAEFEELLLLLLQLLSLMTQLSVTVLALITQVARWCQRRCSPRRRPSFKIFSWVSFTLSIFITKCTFQNQIWEVGIWSKDLTTRKIRSIGCPI